MPSKIVLLIWSKLYAEFYFALGNNPNFGEVKHTLSSSSPPAFHCNPTGHVLPSRAGIALFPLASISETPDRDSFLSSCRRHMNVIFFICFLSTLPFLILTRALTVTSLLYLTGDDMEVQRANPY